MYKMSRKEKFLDSKIEILESFCVPITESIRHKLEVLYEEGNSIAIERYMRSLINE